MALLNLLNRLRDEFRPRQQLRPLHIFQLALLYILILVIAIKSIAQLIVSHFTRPDFFALLIILVMLLCIREVYKGPAGGKWHFHAICVATLFFTLLQAWYYGHYYREPITFAIFTGLMVEFMAYLVLNKIFTLLEGRRYETLFPTRDNPNWHADDVPNKENGEGGEERGELG